MVNEVPVEISPAISSSAFFFGGDVLIVVYFFSGWSNLYIAESHSMRSGEWCLGRNNSRIQHQWSCFQNLLFVGMLRSLHIFLQGDLTDVSAKLKTLRSTKHCARCVSDLCCQKCECKMFLLVPLQCIFLCKCFYVSQCSRYSTYEFVWEKQNVCATFVRTWRNKKCRRQWLDSSAFVLAKIPVKAPWKHIKN